MSDGLAGRIEAGVHRLKVRVYFEDTDFSGVVYHANYLKFMERGRSDFLRLLGVHHGALDAGAHGEPLAFAVHAMAITFRAPARIDDVVEVTTRAGEMTGVRGVLHQEVRRGDGVLVTAEVTVVLVGRDGRPKRWPKPILAALGG